MHTTPPALSAANLAVGYRQGKKSTAIMKGLNLTLERGAVTALLGRNGAGKSTLLRALTGAERPLEGTVAIGGRDTATMGSREMSRLVGLVSTERIAAGGLTVAELVALGRQPHTGFLGRLSAHDREVVERAIASVGMGHKAQSHMAQLSDGERQKAMIARAIAQETPIIVLDEPTAFLDVASRIRLMRLLHTLARSQGKAVLLSSHDVAQSLLLADALWVIADERSMACGRTEDVVMSGALQHMFADPEIEFSPDICDFEATLPAVAAVRLECTDTLLRRCVSGALLRSGIAATPGATQVLEVRSLQEISLNGTAQTSLKAATEAVLAASVKA